MQILLNYLKKTKDYLVNNDDHNQIIEAFVSHNKFYLLTISQSPEEYVSGHRNKKRLFWAVMTKVCLLLAVIRAFLCATIQEVKYLFEIKAI